MGNRAVISLKKAKGEPAIYVHYNGGPESVLAFLQAAKALGVRSPDSDPAYFLARLGQIIGNFFGGTTSVGFGTVGTLDTDNGDNGHYIVGGDFQILSNSYNLPRTMDTMDPELAERSQAMRDFIIECQKAAFDDSQYKKDVVITRVERSK